MGVGCVLCVGRRCGSVCACVSGFTLLLVQRVSIGWTRWLTILEVLSGEPSTSSSDDHNLRLPITLCQLQLAACPA